MSTVKKGLRISLFTKTQYILHVWMVPKIITQKEAEFDFKFNFLVTKSKITVFKGKSSTTLDLCQCVKYLASVSLSEYNLCSYKIIGLPF